MPFLQVEVFLWHLTRCLTIPPMQIGLVQILRECNAVATGTMENSNGADVSLTLNLSVHTPQGLFAKDYSVLVKRMYSGKRT